MRTTNLFPLEPNSLQSFVTETEWAKTKGIRIMHRKSPTSLAPAHSGPVLVHPLGFVLYIQPTILHLKLWIAISDGRSLDLPKANQQDFVICGIPISLWKTHSVTYAYTNRLFLCPVQILRQLKLFLLYSWIFILILVKFTLLFSCPQVEESVAGIVATVFSVSFIEPMCGISSNLDSVYSGNRHPLKAEHGKDLVLFINSLLQIVSTMQKKNLSPWDVS